jgi:hypothetical protein
METMWKACFNCKRTTRHVQLKDQNLSECAVCSTVRDERRVGERLPIYEKRGIGVLCDDGTRRRRFPLWID